MISDPANFVSREPVECNDPIYNTQFTAGFPKFIADLSSTLALTSASSTSNSNSTSTSTSTIASTSFKLLKHNPVHNTSLVLCTPTTGRTHQIRKHLAALGHPIENDDVYKGDGYSAFATALRQYLALNADHHTDNNNNNSQNGKEEQLDLLKQKFEHLQHTLESSKRESELAERCQECGAKLYKDEEGSVDKMRIYLHAMRYTFMDEEGGFGGEEGDGERFETGMPDWAQF